MVSMKDIALVCKVSVATVSKALNDHKDIGNEKKQYIKEVAKQMGYFPNSVARALKTNRTYNIGVLFVEEAQSGLTHNYFAKVLDSFKVTAERRGYDITFLNSNHKREGRMSYLEHSKYRGFDGVVIACVNFADPEVIELIKSDLPVVTIDHAFNDRISIVSDNVGDMRRMLEYIVSCGHSKIAYIHGDPSSVTQSRVSSYYNFLESMNLLQHQEYLKQSAYRDVAMAARRTEELLDLKEPPTCILYPDDFSAYGGMNVIRVRKMRIPEDLSIVGYDGIELAKMIRPRLTTVNQDTRNIGRIAAEKLISLIEKPKSTIIERVLVKGDLEIGETVYDKNRIKEQ